MTRGVDLSWQEPRLVVEMVGCGLPFIEGHHVMPHDYLLGYYMTLRFDRASHDALSVALLHLNT